MALIVTFVAFDPLEVKSTNTTEAALGAVKREINNILSSYVGWFDPLCELIQNALDAVDARSVLEGPESNYRPEIEVIIDLVGNALTVSDNGVGLDPEQFRQFLAPSLSFKNDGLSRGHKGVGATYIAYGFNYMRVSTRVPGFEASGRIRNARKWVKSYGSSSNPKMEPDSDPGSSTAWEGWDRGVSVTVKFDDDTRPRQLDWLGAKDATTWSDVLRVKTGIGSVEANTTILSTLRVLTVEGETEVSLEGTSYLWLHDQASKVARFRDIEEVATTQLARYGPGRAMPGRFTQLDFIHETWTFEEIAELMDQVLDEEDRSVLASHTPSVRVEFGYTAKLWSTFNENLNIRSGQRILVPGIQLAANNMPQGEVIQVPLLRNIGRQNQVHFLFHFDNYTPDLGRKGFHRELSEFAKTVSRYLTDRVLSKYKGLLRPNTGAAPDLAREIAIDTGSRRCSRTSKPNPCDLRVSTSFSRPSEYQSPRSRHANRT